MTHPASVIKHVPCILCDGTGQTEVWDWPKECDASCALYLRAHDRESKLCDLHTVRGFAMMPVSWRLDQVRRALAVCRRDGVERSSAVEAEARMRLASARRVFGIK